MENDQLLFSSKGSDLQNVKGRTKKRIMKEYNEQQYANQLNNLDKMDTFLERNKLPKLNRK